MNIWFYMKNGAQSGPISTEELRGLLTGGLPGDTLVWREGQTGWQAANTLPEFAGVSGQSAMVPPPPPTTAVGDVEQNKVFAVISYLSFLFIVPLVAARQSKFAMYHCNQGLVLFLASIAAWIINIVLAMVLAMIPILGLMLIVLLNFALFAGAITLVIIGIINAANGVCKPLPLIGNRFTLIK